MTSHAGWPPDEHLVMDKGPAGQQRVLTGVNGETQLPARRLWRRHDLRRRLRRRHLGRLPPPGWPAHQTAIIHAGNGKNIIYANDTVNYVWTGTNPATVVHAHENSGVIHCENPHQILFTSRHALPRYRLDGCKRISFYSVGY